ncbi:hypothetical protein K7432_007472 [Basidiobolus ranarum]|uniref:Mid2 domain-containing protein n=1 Tax=Basidiobolus ranarum TaxID=34480 RepID=A0ABR2W0I6_9FUNG
MLFHNALLCFFGAFLSFANISLGSLLSQDIPCGPKLYCNPQNNDVWKLGTVQYLRWNTQFPPLTETVDIRLYDLSNSTYPIKEWLQYNNEGFLTITLTRDYFPVVEKVPRRWVKLVISWDGRPREVNDCPIFAIEDIPESRTTFATIITTTTAKVTVTAKATLMPIVSNRPPSTYVPSPGKSVSTGKAVGIVIGSILAALLLGGAVVFAIRRNREKSPALIDTNESQDVGMSSSDRSGTFGNASTSNVQISPLTENEAYLIADTYRESLRKPGWEDEPNLLL